jgi:glycosyltransferase involved in cell wall biosynthesis
VRLLLVAYYFPPLGLSGVLRPLKFTKYLTRLGWDIEVITSSPIRYYARDESLLRELPRQVSVARTRSLDFFHIGRGGKAAEPAALPGSGARWLSRLVFLPDTKIGWYPFAVSHGGGIAREERPDVVMATAPPFTAFLVGHRLAKRLRVPLVLDYRDSWLMDPQSPPPTAIHRWLAARLEAMVVDASSAVIAVNKRIEEELAARYPAARGRITTIHNGFDPEDLSGLPPVASVFRQPRGLRIIYMGTLSRDVNRPNAFFEALSLVKRDAGEGLGPLEVVFMGAADGPSLMRARELGIADLVGFVPYRPHKEALAALATADAALLLVDPHTFADRHVPGKLFEYLGAGKPVIALAPGDSEAARLVREARAGIVLPPQDPKSIARGLLEWIRMRERGADLPRPDAASLAPYDRREQAALLDRILRGLALAPGRGRSTH